MNKIVLSDYGDATHHSFADDYKLVDRIGNHNKCGGEMCIIPIHTRRIILCYKCGWMSDVLQSNVKTIGALRDYFWC
ncbi:MAG: hypothetical protein WCO21_00400 [bacterium]